MADAYKFTMDMTKVLGAPEEDKSNGLMTSLYPKKRPTPDDPQVAAKPKADGVQPTAMTKLDTLKSDFARIAIETQGEEEINKLYAKQWDKSPTTFDRIRTSLLDRWGADTTVAPSPPRDTPAKPQMERPKRPYMLDASNMPDVPSIIDDVPVADTPDKTTETTGLMTRPKARPFYKGFEVPKYKVYNNPDEMSELEILARTIEAEAALEPYKGKIAVGATIANRASSGSYGKDIMGVILRPAQFSPWNKYTGAAKGQQGKDMMKLRASEDSYKAANDILTGNYDDPTNGATHYVNESIAQGQNWIAVMKNRKKGTVTIGNHLFGNADNNKTYNGKTWVFDRLSETTDQPLVAKPPTIKAIQRIINADADGKFGPASRKKAIKFLKDKGIEVAEDATNKDLMSLVVGA